MGADIHHDDDSSSSSTPQEEEAISVCLRLRPPNKLETSRRGRSCISIDEKKIIVDSPLEGEFEFEYDEIFDEGASQASLHNSITMPLTSRLVSGYNVALLAYGQSTSGKTYTLMGEGDYLNLSPPPKPTQKQEEMHDSLDLKSILDSSFSDFSKKAHPTQKQEDLYGSLDLKEMMNSSNSKVPERQNFRSNNMKNKQPSSKMLLLGLLQPVAPQEKAETETSTPESKNVTTNVGIVPRAIHHLFQLLSESPATMEFTIRCSYIEIHLEKAVDLLHPPNSSVGITAQGIQCASEACCFDAQDVLTLLSKGNAVQKVAKTQFDSRSHTIFTLKLEQSDIVTGITRKSTWTVVDLVGSEVAPVDKRLAAKPTKTALQRETKMLQKSYSALNAVVKALSDQSNPNQDLEIPYSKSKLTRGLKEILGGNCCTTVLLTASPSTYNVTETISTLRFGETCKRITNTPTQQRELTKMEYRRKLKRAEEKQQELKELLREVASECHNLPSIPSTLKIKKLTASFPSEESKDDFEYTTMQQQLKTAKEEKEKTESLLKEYQSQFAILRTQNEKLTHSQSKATEDLLKAQQDIQVLTQRKLEVEHNLRTSQFRENEATVFLRQFRRFYRRLLQNKAAQGNGDTNEITQKVPGVPDLQGLIDVDTLLLESGLIEEEELQDDKSQATYRPSSAALMKSTAAAKKAAKEASALGKTGEGWDDGASGLSASSLGSRLPPSVKIDEKGLDAISEIGDGGVSEMGDESVGRKTAGFAPVAETIDEEGSAVSSRVEGRDGGARLNNAADDLTSIGMRKWNDTPLTGTYGSDARGATTNEESSIVTSSEVVTESVLETNTEVESTVGSEYTESLASSVQLQSIVSRSSKASTITPSNLAARQKHLKTPSGRLSHMRERDLESDLLKMSQRCIDLQIALNEERAHVDVLSNKSGALSKKKLAQEAIQLQKALDRKTHDLQAIIWKMNELHLINKTYNEKMANRELHVMYLEENLVNLQNKNRQIIVEQQESERKLRAELETLKVMTDALKVPLWQFGECSITERNLSNRIMLPMRGHNTEEEKKEDDDVGSNDGSMDMRLLDSEYKAPVTQPPSAIQATRKLEPSRGLFGSDTVDAETQTDFRIDSMEEKKEDKPVMVDKGTDAKKVSMETEGTMTDAVEFADEKASAVMEVAKVSTQEQGIMTDAVEFADEKAPCINEGTMTDAVEFATKKAPCTNEGTMTDAVEFATKKAPCVEEGTMTEPALTFETGTMTIQVNTTEIGIMTDVEEIKPDTTAALIGASAGAGAAITARAIPDGVERGQMARSRGVDDKENVVEKDTKIPAKSNSIERDPFLPPKAVPAIKRDRGLEDASSRGELINPPTHEVIFQTDFVSPLPGGNDDVLSAENQSELRRQSLDQGQHPDTMFPGGKPPNYQPRRFVRKLGPKIKPAVLNEGRRKSNQSSSSRQGTTSVKSGSRRGSGSSRSGSRSRTRSHRI